MKTLRIARIAAAMTGAEYVAWTQTLPPRPFVLDNTYLGGPVSEDYAAIATDAAGTVYVAIGGTDVVIITLDPAGQIVSTTTFGGSASEIVTSIAVDSTGKVIVGGRTISSDLPVANPIQPEFYTATTCPARASWN